MVISVRQVLGFWAGFAALASMVLIWPDEFADKRLFPLSVLLVMVAPLAQGLWFFWKYFMNEKFDG
ncbi:hypothetical protein [Candidatus Halocynthiibacter alkanivorans]|uniref:hypothetical protein n=1 Tax=Candidatus Halocynthiibacter alkanivorans TaxID=2267619 RepID=UPI000DF16FF4|nr:hypothetical protein [Candidatus Halocynthiibacter alkanivorans]